MLPLPKSNAVDEDYRPSRQDLPARRGLEVLDAAAYGPVDRGSPRRQPGVRQMRQRHSGDAILAGRVGGACAPPPGFFSKAQVVSLVLAVLSAFRLRASGYEGRSVQLPPWPWR